MFREIGYGSARIVWQLRCDKDMLPIAAIVVLALGVGIAYPAWWRSKHHPFREDAREKRARRITAACRTAAFISLVGFLVSWVVGSEISSWVALAFLVVGGAMFMVGFQVEDSWRRALQRRGTLAERQP